MRYLTVLIALILAPGAAALALPELSAPQKAQLDTATDGSATYDEAALYPLLEDAVWWKAGDESGAAIPNYDTLAANPAAHRGELYLIEGKFGGLPQPDWDKVTLSRSGGWNERIRRWGIQVQEDPSRVVLVLFVDPPRLPNSGYKVRLPARFFKVWTNKDMLGRDTQYLVFVGKSAVVVRDPNTPGLNPGTPYTLPAVMVAVLLVSVAYFVIRRKAGWKNRSDELARERQRMREERLRRDEEDGSPDTSGPPLPKDPVAALEELERRRKAGG